MINADKLQIKKFIKTCEKLRIHKFYSETDNLSMKINKSLSQDHSLEFFDEDIFRSFLLDFRKVIMDDEPTFFNKIHNIIFKSKPSFKNKLGKLHNQFNKKHKEVYTWIQDGYFHEDKNIKQAPTIEDPTLVKYSNIVTVLELTTTSIELSELAKNIIGVNYNQKKDSHKKSANHKKISVLRSNNSLLRFGELAKKINKVSSEQTIKFSHQEQARLFLLASGLLYDDGVRSEILGNHELHFAYLYRDSMELLPDEKWLILRTLVSDPWDQKTGWYWLPKISKNLLIKFAVRFFVNDGSEDVKIGVLNLLGKYWNNNYLKTLEILAKDESKTVKKRVLSLALEKKSKDMLKIIRILDIEKESDDEKSIKGLEIDLLIKQDYLAALNLISKSEDMDRYRIKNLNLLFRKLDTEELNNLKSSTSNLLRIFCHVELIRRKLIKPEQLRSLLSDNQWELRYFALKELILQNNNYTPDEISRILKLEDPIKRLYKSYLYDLDELLEEDIIRLSLSNKTSTELQNIMDWSVHVGPIAYDILGQNYFAEYKKEIRSDLVNNLTSKKEILMNKLATRWQTTLESVRKTYEKYDELMVNLFREPALRAVLKNGSYKDVKIAKILAKLNKYNLNKLCIGIITKYGSQKDSLFLFNLASSTQRYGEQDIALAGALYLDSKDKYRILDRTLELNDPRMICIALGHAVKHKKYVDIKKIEPFLRHENDNLRIVALAYICSRNKNNNLTKLLTSYTTGHYYYNVVCWLDRVLHSSPSLGNEFRKELNSKLLTNFIDIKNYEYDKSNKRYLAFNRYSK